jgi:hypothetical protein
MNNEHDINTNLIQIIPDQNIKHINCDNSIINTHFMKEIFYNYNYEITKKIGNILEKYILMHDVFLINSTSNISNNNNDNILTSFKFTYNQNNYLHDFYKIFYMLPFSECQWFNNICLQNTNIITGIFEIEKLEVIFNKIISCNIFKIISKNIEEFCNEQLNLDFVNVIVKNCNSNILNICNKHYYVGLLVFSNTTITLSKNNHINQHLIIEPGYIIIFNSTISWEIYEKNTTYIVFYIKI